MDYSLLITDKIFGEKKSTFSNVLKSSKMGVWGPPQAENLGVQTPLWTIPPYYRQISNKERIVHKDSIDPSTSRPNDE